MGTCKAQSASYACAVGYDGTTLVVCYGCGTTLSTLLTTNCGVLSLTCIGFMIVVPRAAIRLEGQSMKSQVTWSSAERKRTEVKNRRGQAQIRSTNYNTKL